MWSVTTKWRREHHGNIIWSVLQTVGVVDSQVRWWWWRELTNTSTRQNECVQVTKVSRDYSLTRNDPSTHRLCQQTGDKSFVIRLFCAKDVYKRQFHLCSVNTGCRKFDWFCKTETKCELNTVDAIRKQREETMANKELHRCIWLAALGYATWKAINKYCTRSVNIKSCETGQNKEEENKCALKPDKQTSALSTATHTIVSIVRMFIRIEVAHYPDGKWSSLLNLAFFSIFFT